MCCCCCLSPSSSSSLLAEAPRRCVGPDVLLPNSPNAMARDGGDDDADGGGVGPLLLC